MGIEVINALFYAALIIALLGVMIFAVNPYRLQRYLQLDEVLPDDVQSDLNDLTNAWAGRVRVTATQLRLMQFIGFFSGLILGFVLGIFVSFSLGVFAAIALSILFAAYPSSRFIEGFSRPMLFALEREAPRLASYFYRSIGVSHMSVSATFSQMQEVYPDLVTTDLLSEIPQGVNPFEAVLGMGFPNAHVQNWLEVFGTVSIVTDLGNPDEVLSELRNRIQEREENYLRGVAKRKAFQAPLWTVLLLLLPLMALILVPVAVQAWQTLSGGI